MPSPVPANDARPDAAPLMNVGPDFAAHPETFRARQRAAWKKFESLPMPTRTDESWRFADVKSLSIAPQSIVPQHSLLIRLLPGYAVTVTDTTGNTSISGNSGVMPVLDLGVDVSNLFAAVTGLPP